MEALSNPSTGHRRYYGGSRAGAMRPLLIPPHPPLPVPVISISKPRKKGPPSDMTMRNRFLPATLPRRVGAGCFALCLDRNDIAKVNQGEWNCERCAFAIPLPITHSSLLSPRRSLRLRGLLFFLYFSALQKLSFVRSLRLRKLH